MLSVIFPADDIRASHPSVVNSVPDAVSASSPHLLSIILPTRNESQNIEPLLKRIAQATDGLSVEVIFVDDSTDNTPQVIRGLSNRFVFPVRLIARPPERRTGGLGGAVVEGFRNARGHWACVMDADLQHPPEMIPELLRHAQESNSDLVIGSRFVNGASTPGLNQLRTAISETLILSARVLFIDRLRHVKDPLTGFFLVQRDKINLDQLRPNGFKILLEIIVQFPAIKLSELGFKMESRHAGESKASMQEVTRYFRKLIELRLTRGNPRFLYFMAVGLTGIVINNLALALFTEVFHLYYLASALFATQVSTVWNFLLTEFWVFGDRRSHRSVWKRFVGFALINNALLLVRSPMMAGLVEGLKMHYLAANVISIGAATMLRYFFADKLLWSSKDPATKTSAFTAPPLSQPKQQSQ